MKGRALTVPIAIPLALALLLVGTLGCAGVRADVSGPRLSQAPSEASGPQKAVASLEQAAIAALIEARAEATPVERESLLAGSIVRVEGGYRADEPQHSGSCFSTRVPTVRLDIDAEHAALFVVQPRTGNRRLDRIGEDFTPHQRRLVDDVDPLHRPIYLLTPSGRILAYVHGERALEIARVHRGRVELIESESNATTEVEMVDSATTRHR